MFLVTLEDKHVRSDFYNYFQNNNCVGLNMSVSDVMLPQQFEPPAYCLMLW